MTRLLVTGGAGFIGTNFVRFASGRGYSIVVIDNFAKDGSRSNAQLLRTVPSVEVIAHDVTQPLSRDFRVDGIVHLAANVDAARAMEDPRADFMVNALGTLNVLEYARQHGNVPVVYASTCKVYSTLINTLHLIEREERFEYQNAIGIDETFPTDAQCRYGHAPYGCSKYTGDLYAQEYHTLFGLPVVINRMSTIYGPYQHGAKGYGWVWWFTRAFKQGLPVTIFGDGKQVRDVLHVDDLCRLFLTELENPDIHVGQIYNVGGGSENTLSLLELMRLLRRLNGGGPAPPVTFESPRPADFRVYVSDITKVKTSADWKPEVSVEEGVTRLWNEF